VNTNLKSFYNQCLQIPRGFEQHFSTGGNADFNMILTDMFDIIENPTAGEYDIIKKGYANFSDGGGIISDKKHPVFRHYRELEASLKTRADSSLFTLEGELLVNRALKDGLPVLSLLHTPEYKINDASVENIAVYEISQPLMSAITPSYKQTNVVAIVANTLHDANDFTLSGLNCLLICDSLTNPDNLGMVLRTADACGADITVVLGDKNMIFARNCVRSARGAIGRTLIAGCNNENLFFERLRTNGFSIAGTSAKSSGIIQSENINTAAFKEKTAFIIGNETTGVRPEILSECDRLIKIPMTPGQSSLNVAVAAGIILYEFTNHQS